MGRGGGAGGRIRFRAAKSGYFADAHDDIVKRRNTSRFNFFNSGCFFKSHEQHCPNRLADFYCEIWTEKSEDVEFTDSPLSPTAVSSTLSAAGDSADDSPLCAGDFTTDWIISANNFSPPLLLALATFVNFLTLRVAFRYAGKQMPVCHYLWSLAALDTLLLYIRLMDLWLQSTTDVKLNLTLMVMDESACQLISMLHSGLHHFKSMLQIGMAIDSRRLVLQPLRCAERYTGEWVKNSIILMCVLVVLINAHHLWTLTIVRDNSLKDAELLHCGWTLRWPITDLFTNWIWPITDLAVGDVIPICVSVLAAVSCLGNRWRTPGRLREYVMDAELHGSLRAGLLGCCAAFAVLQLPSAAHSCIMHAVSGIFRLTVGAEAAEANDHVMYWPYEDETRLYVTRLCSDCQKFINFFVLAILVPRFRYDVCKIFTGSCRRRRVQFKVSQGQFKVTKSGNFRKDDRTPMLVTDGKQNHPTTV